MEDVFDRKVHEKEKKLAICEEDLKKKLYESQENLDKQKIDLEAKMATFEKVILWFKKKQKKSKIFEGIYQPR